MHLLLWGYIAIPFDLGGIHLALLCIFDYHFLLWQILNVLKLHDFPLVEKHPIDNLIINFAIGEKEDNEDNPKNPSDQETKPHGEEPEKLHPVATSTDQQANGHEPVEQECDFVVVEECAQPAQRDVE